MKSIASFIRRQCRIPTCPSICRLRRWRPISRAQSICWRRCDWRESGSSLISPPKPYMGMSRVWSTNKPRLIRPLLTVSPSWPLSILAGSIMNSMAWRSSLCALPKCTVLKTRCRRFSGISLKPFSVAINFPSPPAATIDSTISMSKTSCVPC
ncbi:hypothetical protein D9M69_619740 [compost metagenome]